MSQKGLSNLLKAIIIGMGICGLIVYFYILPVYGKLLASDNPLYPDIYYAWMYFLWTTCIPCYLVLVFGWKIAIQIGNDNSFSIENAKSLKNIAYLAAVDTVIMFVGSGVLLVFNLSTAILEMLALLVVFVGASFIVVAAALSHLVYKAACIQEENELTI